MIIVVLNRADIGHFVDLMRHAQFSWLPVVAVLQIGTYKPIYFSPIITDAAHLETSAVFARMKTRVWGLTEAEGATRLDEVGPNVVLSEKHHGWLWRLLPAARN